LVGGTRQQRIGAHLKDASAWKQGNYIIDPRAIQGPRLKALYYLFNKCSSSGIAFSNIQFRITAVLRVFFQTIPACVVENHNSFALPLEVDYWTIFANMVIQAAVKDCITTEK
jgi:hypothetical protein